MNRFSHFYCILLSVLCLTGADRISAQTSTYLPEPHALDRYMSLWQKSPFSPESVIVETAPNSQWLMTGITVLDDDPMITLTNRDTFKTVSLSPGESADSVSLVRADWAGSYEDSYAVVSINGAEKKIAFDEQSLSTLSARTAPQTSTQKPAPGKQSNGNLNQNQPARRVIAPARKVITPNSSNNKKFTPRRRIISRPSS